MSSSHHSPQVSADLVWEIVRNQNSYLVKRKTQGGILFSRDPYNLLNVHSRKNAGFVNDKAVGIGHAAGDKGGVTLLTKKSKHAQKPGAASHSVTFGANKTPRKTYKSIASSVAKSGYRADLRATAIARASAIRKAQRPAKDLPEPKLRGKKAKVAAVKEA